MPAPLATSSSVTTIPPSLLGQLALRLRVVALLYAFVFAMVGILPPLVLPEMRVGFFGNAARWLPPVLSITMALVVAALTTRPGPQGAATVRLGLAFQVLASAGIAAAEYLAPATGYARSPLSGLSWVAVWMLSFTVIVPSPPAWALTAACLSALTVPAVSLLAASLGTAPAIARFPFVIHVVVPYALVVVIAYAGAKLVYRLGVDLTRALDLGSYRLVERLAYGGMGEVWRATHRLLARPAAVKVIRPELLAAASPAKQAELRTRFECEAQAIAQLTSPHTVDLFDYGVTDDGAFYYVMELLEGFDLQTMVQRFGPLPVSRVVHLLTQVCHALAEAHGAGIVHRDLSPANVFVCRYGRDVDVVKVLDFGLLKSTSTTSDEPSVTQVEGARGTPAFMAPEQALGQPHVDARADLYAVGCLAYWLVTGQVVFPRPTSMATLIAHAQAEPDRPSLHAELPVPPEFDALVLACLAKEPAQRPRNADELAARLRAIPVEPWRPDEALAWWSRHHPKPAA